MPNAEKIQKVTGLKERIKAAEALLLAEYRGLSVHDATELRRSLAGHARFAIVKNTLMERAAADAGMAELRDLLDGPTAVAFVREDAVATAKTIVDAAKRFPALVLKGGYMDGRVLSAAEAQALATLESREVILSRLAGMMKAELGRAAHVFQALQSRFVGVLEAYQARLPGEPEAQAAATAPPATEAAADEPTAEQPPAAEEPAVEEPTAEQPAVEEPTAEQPAAETEPGPEGQAPATEPDSEPETPPETEPEDGKE